MNQSGFILIMMVIFFIESIAEARLFSILRVVKPSRDQRLEKRRRRVLAVEIRWNWLSWIILFVLLLTPEQFAYFTVAIIVLMETIVVMELDHVWQRMKVEQQSNNHH